MQMMGVSEEGKCSYILFLMLEMVSIIGIDHEEKREQNKTEIRIGIMEESRIKQIVTKRKNRQIW